MRLTLGLVVAALAAMPVQAGMLSAMPVEAPPQSKFLFGQTMRMTSTDTNSQTVTRPGFGRFTGAIPQNQAQPIPLPDIVERVVPITSAAAKDAAKKACVGSDASSTACAAAITAFVEALKRENIGADAAKKIDSAIGNFAYELYGAQPIGSLDATKRAILSKAISQLAESVTDSVQKSSIKAVATSVGDGKPAEKNAFYQNSASVNTVALSVSLDTLSAPEYITDGRANLNVPRD